MQHASRYEYNHVQLQEPRQFTVYSVDNSRRCTPVAHLRFDFIFDLHLGTKTPARRCPVGPDHPSAVRFPDPSTEYAPCNYARSLCSPKRPLEERTRMHPIMEGVSRSPPLS